MQSDNVSVHTIFLTEISSNYTVRKNVPKLAVAKWTCTELVYVPKTICTEMELDMY